MELLYYFLKVSACSALFFTFYLLVLRRLTFFKINRFYLLITLLISFIIPTLHFTVEREIIQAEAVSVPEVDQQPEIAGQAFQLPIQTETVATLEDAFDYYSLLPYLYFSIVVCLLAFAGWRLIKLIKHTRNSITKINGLKIVSKVNGFTNCSFFNYVFIDEGSLTETELSILLKHEEVHARQLHSIDKIMMMVIKAILWFNPIVYLYDKALEQAHEYEADEATSQNFGTPEYASLLLRLAVSKSEMALVHNFVKSPIKERIKMLFNSKSKKMKKLMYLLALPIGLGLLWSFTVKIVAVTHSPKSTKENVVAKKKILSKHLWGKTIKGKIKSILQTEVGEILNFKYDETTIEIFNLAKGKVKVGEELLIIISGTVDGITVKDGKGKVVKQLEEPCYLMSKLSRLNGDVLYQLNTPTIKAISLNNKISNLNVQDTIKTQKQKNLQRQKEYEAFRKTPEYAKKIQEMKDLDGKTLSGVVGDDYTKGSGIFGKGKLFKVGNAIYILEKGFAKEDALKSITKNDRVTIVVDYSSFNKDIPYLMISAKTITKDGKLLYTAPTRPNPKQYAFLYEANKARYAWSIIKSIDKNIDGTINKIVLNDNGFTINLNVADQKFKTKDFKIGSSVIVKFFGEKLAAKNTYNTDKMIVLYSWPKKYELKNKVLYNRFYYEDGTQKVNEKAQITTQKAGIKSSTISKPILNSSSSMRVDAQRGISYVVEGKYSIGDIILEAKESTYDNVNNTIKAIKATITKNGHMIVSDEIVINVNANYFTVKEIKEPFRLSTFSKIETDYQGVGIAKKVKHFAEDSTRIDKINQLIYLYGNATIANEKMKFKGSEITYNTKLNTATIKNATYYDNEARVTADVMEVDFNKSKVISKRGDLKMSWK